MLHMFDPRPLAFGSRSELRNSSDKKWQAKGKKYYKTKMERGSKCENEKDKKKKAKRTRIPRKLGLCSITQLQNEKKKFYKLCEL